MHNRDPRPLPLITAGATVLGDGVLAQTKGLNVVFCQIAPWQFEATRCRISRKRIAAQRFWSPGYLATWASIRPHRSWPAFMNL